MIPPPFIQGIPCLCIDACSMIYHLKTGLLGSLAAEVSLISTPQVLAEVGWPHLPVKALALDQAWLSNDESLLTLARNENVPLVSEDFEVLEEARREGRDHYNTLMMLAYLLLKKRVTAEEYPEYLERLKNCAHYSRKVLETGTSLCGEILKFLES